MGPVGWRSLLLLRRARDQAAVLAAAVVVVLVSTTLVGTFALLVTVTSDRAVAADLAAAPGAEIALRSSSRLRGGPPGPVVEAIDGAVDRVLGDVPSDRSHWLIGRLWALEDPGGRPGEAAYPATVPVLRDGAELVTGAWPERGRDEEGRLQVAVPAVLAEQRGWHVGAVVPTATQQRERLTDTWVVTGVYRSAGDLASWAPDRLDGAGVEHRYPIGPAQSVDLYGPVVVTPDALAGDDLVEYVHHLAVPRPGEASAPTLTTVREALDTAEPTIKRAAAKADASADFDTGLDEAVDRARRASAVTSSGVVAVGLLLVVLTVTVMLLTARLAVERRAGEMELLAARGASPAQLRTLAVAEAGLLALLTAAAAPWLARGAHGALSAAGVLGGESTDLPPGVPLPVLLACASVAVLLAVALVVPAWHVRGSSAASARVRLVRAGADLALVVHAGVALWQLLTYGTLTGARGSGVDPVLVAGPALVVLGAATVALRLVRPAARVADVVARRSTSLVAPLAAWQVARRPATTSGTALVVVLTVTAATFTHALLATWTTSQRDQVDLALGADGRVTTGPRAWALAEAEAVRAATTGTSVRIDPFLDRPVSIGRSRDGLGAGSSTDARLLGVDSAAPGAMRGDTGTGGSWSDVVTGLAEPGGGEARAPAGPIGVPLPAGTEWLYATVSVESAPQATGTVHPAVAVEDEWGVRTWLSGSAVTTNTGPVVSWFGVPAGTGALRIVAASVAVPPLVTLERLSPELADRPVAYQVGTSLHSLRTSERGARPSPPDPAGPTVPLVVGTGVSWQGSTISQLGTRLVPPDRQEVPERAGLPADALVFTGTYVQESGTGAVVVAHAWPTQAPVRAVVSDRLAEDLALEPGDEIVVDVAQTEVPVVVAAVAPHLPGGPRGSVLLVDQGALSRAVLERGGSDPAVDGWRLTGDAEDVAETAARITQVNSGAVTLREVERADATGGPLFVALPASLTLATASAALLVVVGLGAAAASAVRSRRLETARVQALGAHRSSVVAGLVAEQALLVLTGAVAGLGIGYGTATVVAPLLTASQDGRRPVPDAVVQWHWGTELMLTAGLAVAACGVAALLTAALVRRASGSLLRLGDNR